LALPLVDAALSQGSVMVWTKDLGGLRRMAVTFKVFNANSFEGSFGISRERFVVQFKRDCASARWQTRLFLLIVNAIAVLTISNHQRTVCRQWVLHPS